jgi:hypothetical protein
VEAVGASVEEFEEAEVAEDLELLADFVGDVGEMAGEKPQPLNRRLRHPAIFRRFSTRSLILRRCARIL